MSKVAFITGITGQDGSLLAKQLLESGWTVYGGFRRGSSNKTWRMDHLGITKKVKLVEFQLGEIQNLIETFQNIKPDAIYNLAGESFVADSFKYPNVTMEANTQGTVNVLEAMRLVAPEASFFYASSAEVFGHNNDSKALDENSECRPSNPYGISKLSAQHFVRLYRERYGLRTCSGILFNHESALRGRNYVTRKITFNMARLKTEGGPAIELGDLNASRDWGAAEDYVKAMHLMTELNDMDDLVIASGRLSSVRDFFRIAASEVGYDPVFEGEGANETCIDGRSGTVLAKVSDKYFRPHDTRITMGDPTRIKSLTGWEGSRGLEQLVKEMIEADLDRWKRGITNV